MEAAARRGLLLSAPALVLALLIATCLARDLRRAWLPSALKSPQHIVGRTGTYEQKARDAESKAQRCEEEKARLQAEQGGPGGLRGLRAAGLLDQVRGVTAKRIGDDIKPRPRAALALVEAGSYRAGSEERGRVAVELGLKNPGTKPWTLAGAVLRGAKGEELTPLPEDTPVSILPGASGRVMVEFDATTTQAQGAYTLTLWDADGRSVILENVTFP